MSASVFAMLIAYAILLTARFKRLIFLEAVFLWYTPLEAALSIALVAFNNSALASSLSFAAIAASTFFDSSFNSGFCHLIS